MVLNYQLSTLQNSLHGYGEEFIVYISWYMILKNPNL
jgi:hypothetical protein